MTPLADKFALVASRIESAKGPFALYAVLMRADEPDRWSVVVAAPWLDGAGLAELTYVARELAAVLTAEEMRSLARIAPMQTTDQAVRSLAAESAGHVPVKYVGPFAGADVTAGHILAARAATTPAPHAASSVAA